MNDSELDKIDKAVKDNPDLPEEFIVGALEAKAEVDNGLMVRYSRRTDKEKHD